MAVGALAVAASPASAYTIHYDVSSVRSGPCYGYMNAYWDATGTAYVQGVFFSDYGQSVSCGWGLYRKGGTWDPWQLVSNPYTVAPGQSATTGWHWDGSNNGVLSNICTTLAPGVPHACSPGW